MKWLKMFCALMLAWGSTTAFAKPDPDLQTVKAWMAHLNSYYGDLNVMPRQGANSARMLRDLKALEDVLHEQLEVEDGALITIACARAVCGDNPNGPCHTCAPF
jgi:hypothetical protein